MEGTAGESCAICHKSQHELASALKKCGRCRATSYCSQECQKADWKTHKRTCRPEGASDPTSGPHNPGFYAAQQLTGLADGDWLHKLAEQEVYNYLVDCFRMRVEDEYRFCGDASAVHMGEDSMDEFREFLKLAERRETLLPSWWNAQKRRACEQSAVRAENWSNINQAIEKSDVREHYRDNMMPMKLRVLGEQIYGKGFL